MFPVVGVGMEMSSSLAMYTTEGGTGGMWSETSLALINSLCVLVVVVVVVVVGGGGGHHILIKHSLLGKPTLLTEVFEHSPRSTSVSF